MTLQKPMQILIPMHNNFDVMDFFGPIEVFSHGRLPSTADSKGKPIRAFSFTAVSVSSTPLATSEPGIQIASSITLEEAYSRLSDFDMLIVPGGSSAEILNGRHAEPMKLIQTFASLPPRPDSERVIMSVCTGALFLAQAGVLDGQTATTNTQHLDQLRKMVEGRPTRVVEKGERFVVNPVGGVRGVGREGVRVVTSAGPGAGLDLSLWLLEHWLGEKARVDIEMLVEHKGRLNDGLILGEA